MTLIDLRIATRPASSTPKSPIDLLLACHERIRSFTALSARLAQQLESDPTAISEVAGSILRFFTVALPLHSEDEDLSLLPRMKRTGTPDGVIAALEAMNRQHREIADVLGGMASLWRELERAPARLPHLAAELAAASERLAGLVSVHLELEETAIFPAVLNLEPGDSQAILSEMRARRGGGGAPRAS